MVAAVLRIDRRESVGDHPQVKLAALAVDDRNQPSVTVPLHRFNCDGRPGDAPQVIACKLPPRLLGEFGRVDAVEPAR